MCPHHDSHFPFLLNRDWRGHYFLCPLFSHLGQHSFLVVLPGLGLFLPFATRRSLKLLFGRRMPSKSLSCFPPRVGKTLVFASRSYSCFSSICTRNHAPQKGTRFSYCECLLLLLLLAAALSSPHFLVVVVLLLVLSQPRCSSSFSDAIQLSVAGESRQVVSPQPLAAVISYLPNCSSLRTLLISQKISFLFG